MKYNPGDIVKTEMTETHAIILAVCIDPDGWERYKMSPLHDLSRSFMYDKSWVDDKMVLVQKGKR